MKPLTHRLYLIGQHLAASADRILRTEHGLGFTEFLLLRAVSGGPPMSQGELADIVGVGEAGVSRIVTRLAGRGLLSSTPDPGNRRRSLLSATPEGARLADAASALLEGRFGVLIEGAASSDDLAVFESVLNILLEMMENKK